MASQSFSYKIGLLLTKYARRLANLFKKNSEMFGENFLGLDILFAIMSDPPTPNFQFLVQSSLQV